MSRFFNFVFYQVGWFACVLGLAWNRQWLGIGVALCLVGLHFWLASDRVIQIKLGLAAAACGLLVDSAQLRAGIFEFPNGSVIDGLPPPSITVLWLQFATTFRYSVSWLSRRYVACAGLGLVGAPLAFWAGERLGAIEFLSPRPVNFAILGSVWAIAVPLLVALSDAWASSCGAMPSYRWPSTRDRMAG